jgi:hypothetical protein
MYGVFGVVVLHVGHRLELGENGDGVAVCSTGLDDGSGADGEDIGFAVLQKRDVLVGKRRCEG